MRLTIDRFEGKFAVCEMEDEKMVNIEKSKLHPEAKEGDVYNITNGHVSFDKKATEEKKAEIDNLMNDAFE